MKLAASKKLTIVLALLLFMALISLTLMGPSHALGMQMNDKGQMSGCIFDGMSEICTMNLPEHLSTWLGLFTAVSVKTVSASISLILLAVALFLYRNLLLYNPRFQFRRLHYPAFNFRRSRYKLARWLSLLENSPSFLVFARI